MVVSSSPPVFANLRRTLHLLIICLIGFIIIRERLYAERASLVLAISFVATYLGGVIGLRGDGSGRLSATVIWLAALTGEALALIWISPSAAYLIVPLYFLYLHRIPQWWDVVAVAGSSLLTILVLAISDNLTAGGVIGPLVGAAFAIAIGMGYRTLYWENVERQQLIEELLATREELRQKEREAGVLSERARLAREIHDTVAQGLSSIQLLLFAAERTDPDRPGHDHIRLARETAAANLDETRRLIRELTPAALEGDTLAGALERLAGATYQASPPLTDGADQTGQRLMVEFRTSGDPVALPLPIETALLRIAQGAIANVVQHAAARRATMTLTYMDDSVSLDVVDDGRGFDPAPAAGGSPRDRQSFGLTAMRARVAQLGGEITIESTPGGGAALAVTFGLDP